MTVWRCPKCSHTEQQPASAAAVGHWCPNARRLVDLEPQPTEPRE